MQKLFKWRPVTWAAAVLAIAACPVVRSQVFYGELLGSVTDPSGAVVPAATVMITNQQSGQVRKTATSASGTYSFADALPGAYRVEVTAGGFQTSIQTGVQVSINTVTRLNVALNVGQTSEAVTVSAAASVLQADKSDVHVELATKELTELPLSAYRNFQSLVNLVPGATPGALQNSVNDTPQRDLSANVNGTNRNANNVHLDGALDKMNIINSHVMYVPPAESIETVNISTDAFDAEQGMTGGAALTVITKDPAATRFMAPPLLSIRIMLFSRAISFSKERGLQRASITLMASRWAVPLGQTHYMAFGQCSIATLASVL